jgi:glycosyltransferase involved in cell wall biosynthesis
MNLAFVVQQGLYPFGGGTGVYLDRVTRSMAKQGNRVWLLSSTPKDADDYRKDGVQYIHVPMRRSAIPFTSLLRWEWRVGRLLRQIEAEHGLDMVEFPSYHPEGLVYTFSRRRAAICIRFHESKHPVKLRDLYREPREWLRETLCWLQMARADVIMPFSIPMHETCVRFMGQARYASKVYTIRSGIDMDLFSPTPQPPAAYRALEGKRIILFVGRITEEKGTYNLIEAFRQRILPRYADTVLVLIGEPEDAERLRRTLLDNEGAVVHVDRVEQRELPAFYSHAYVFVAPSRHEPFGLVFVEALACGLPVVSVAQGGPLEIVEPGKTGLLCPDYSPGSIAQAIEQLLDDADLRDRMASSARASVVGRFSIDGVASDMIARFGSIRNGRNGS